MTRGERWIVGAVVVLAVSVLATGGLVVRLSLARRQGEGSGAGGSATDLAAGSRIAFVSDREGDAAVYITTADGSEVRRVSGRGYVVRGPSWSPDGQRLAYLAWDADGGTRIEVHVVLVDEAEGAGDEVVAGFEVEPVEISAPAWSPDGTVLAVAVYGPAEGGERQSTLYFLGVGDGDAAVERTLVVPRAVSSLQWSPSGDALLIVSTDYPPPPWDTCRVDLLAEDGGELTTLWHGALTTDWSPDGGEIVVGDWESSLVIVLGRDGAPRRAFELPDGPQWVDWSPDGAQIAVLAADPAYGPPYRVGNSLHLITVETSVLTTIVEPAGPWLHALSWSADSVVLTFTKGQWVQRAAGPFNVYAELQVYDLVSGQMESVAYAGGFDGLGAWSP